MQAHCTVSVMSAPESISFTTNEVNLDKGEKTQLECTFPISSIACNITYMSSDPSVCRVDKNGIVTAKSKGKATVSARTFNGRIAFCEINVE